MVEIKKDVIVLGLGAWGSAALWRLAARGVDVAGIERYGIGHVLGSTHGSTRLFRIACQEHTGLSPIALKSLELWTGLAAETGEEYVSQSGVLSSGAPDSVPVAGTIRAAEMAGTPVTRFSHDQFVDRYPGYGAVQDQEVAVLDTAGGVCYPERFVRGHVAAAQRLGADVYPDTRVTRLEITRDGIRVHTATAVFTAAKVVVALGAWMPKFFPTLPFRPKRTPLYWFDAKPGHADEYRLENFPGFIRELPNGMLMWGHGSSDDFGIKIGLGDDAKSFQYCSDADTIDRYIHQREDIDELKGYVAQAFPGIEPQPSMVIPCVVTESPDQQFIIGRHPLDDRIVVAGGDSGHGAKHAAGIGELLAQLTVGEAPFADASFMSPDRFSE